MDIQTDIERAQTWGANKGITGPYGTGTIERQSLKLLEECEETRVGLDKLQNAKTTVETWAALDEIQDGLGDMMVVMILICEMTGLNFGKCLNSALGVIEARTGRMIDGQFVKDK